MWRLKQRHTATRHGAQQLGHDHSAKHYFYVLLRICCPQHMFENEFYWHNVEMDELRLLLQLGLPLRKSSISKILDASCPLHERNFEVEICAWDWEILPVISALAHRLSSHHQRRVCLKHKDCGREHHWRRTARRTLHPATRRGNRRVSWMSACRLRVTKISKILPTMPR